MVLRAVVVAGVATPLRAAADEELPAEFASRTSPLAADPTASQRGKALFLDNCASCHGEAADGHGPASVGLRPPPANLAGPAIVPAHSDAYLFYRLTVGKRGSAMPAFGNSLSETERWEVIAYLRSLSQRAVRCVDERAFSAATAALARAALQSQAIWATRFLGRGDHGAVLPRRALLSGGGRSHGRSPDDRARRDRPGQRTGGIG